MTNRLGLQTLLEEILGSRNVYYQPPSSVRMSYPAIVYSRNRLNNTFANNAVYKQDDAYSVTVIDYDPDSEIARTISNLSRCRADRFFASDNLNHFVFTIYF